MMDFPKMPVARDFTLPVDGKELLHMASYNAALSAWSSTCVALARIAMGEPTTPTADIRMGAENLLQFPPSTPRV